MHGKQNRNEGVIDEPFEDSHKLGNKGFQVKNVFLRVYLSAFMAKIVGQRVIVSIPIHWKGNRRHLEQGRGKGTYAA